MRFDGKWVKFWSTGYEEDSAKCKFYADGSLRFKSGPRWNPLHIVQDSPDNQFYLNLDKSGDRAFFMAEKVPQSLFDSIFQGHLY